MHSQHSADGDVTNQGMAEGERMNSPTERPQSNTGAHTFRLGEAQLSSTYPFILYTVIFSGIFNAILRPGEGSPITPYYILAPLVMLPVALLNRAAFKGTLAMLAIIAYGFIAAVLYGLPIRYFAPQAVHYVHLGLLFIGLEYLRLNDELFYQRITKILYICLGIITLSIAAQHAFGVELPNVKSEYGGRYFNTFFYTPNDLALFLGALSILVIFSRLPIIAKLTLFGAFWAINVVNDSRAVVMAQAIIAAVYCTALIAKFFRVRVAVVAFVALLIFGGFFSYVLTQNIQIGPVQIKVSDIIMDPAQRIIELRPYSMAGSVFDRANALIYNLKEFSTTYGLGIGPGGSRYVLTLPQYPTYNAETMHNAIGELSVEMGVLFIVPLLVAAGYVISLMFKPETTRAEMAQVALLASAPLLSLSQSGGYISNYAFWIVFYLIVRGQIRKDSTCPTRLLPREV